MDSSETSKKRSSASKRKRRTFATTASESHSSSNSPTDPSPRVKDATWSQADGYDLRWDKPKIYKRELSTKDHTEIPLVKEAQQHICKDRILKERPPPDDPNEWKMIKSIALKKMKKAALLKDYDKLQAKFLKVEALLYKVVYIGGHYEAEEADDVVDFFILGREREGCHPLQRTRVRGTGVIKVPNTSFSLDTPLLFMHQPLRDALRRRGFYLNVGQFSSSESLTLMKNFESFLLQNGFSTDKESKWKYLSEDFHHFHLQTRIFIYIGDNLNRTSRQLYRHLLQVYHPFERGSFDAATDAILLEEAATFKAKGSKKYHTKIGDVVNRHRGAVGRRLQHLTGVHDKTTKTQPEIYEAICEYMSSSECCDAEVIPFAEIGGRLGFHPNVIEKFWLSVGKLQYQKSLLPKWTLKDSLTLLQEIQKSEEDDENAIDFGDIKARCFEGKVVNLQQLRERFNRIRRAVPYYMLSDLQSVVAAAIKKVEADLNRGCLEGSVIE